MTSNRKNIVCLASAALVLLAPAIARAEGDTVSARFPSTARPYLIEAAACSMRMGTVGDRPFDVRVGARRCSLAPIVPGAIPLTVSWEPRDDPQTVVVDAPLPSAAFAGGMQTAITYASDALKAQILAAAKPLENVQSSSSPNHGANSTFVRNGGLAFVLIVGVVALVSALVVAVATSPHGLSF